MRAQDGIKRRVKTLLFRGPPRPRRLKRGPARGALFVVDRRHDLQRELGLYEVELTPLYRRVVSADATVFDVGAADGYSAVTLASLASRGRVVCFEPDPAQRARLAQNMALNPVLARRVEVVDTAAGRGGDDGRALDDLVEAREVPVPDVVKIDVDGGELAVLEGMHGILADHRPCLVVETHSRELERAASAVLATLAYDVTVVRNAWWRTLWPELRPVGHNRWLLAVPQPGGAADDGSAATSRRA